jgi:hypothetical protein
MPQIQDKILANRLRSIAGELVGLSKNIDSDGLGLMSETFMFGDPAAARTVEEADDLALAAFAENLYQERRRRTRFLPEHLFAEPAWDILLDLFVNGVRNRAISITSACIAGGIPATTGLRWLGVLEKEGLLVRETSGGDARVTWVRLSQDGMNIMRSYIGEACGQPAAASSPPRPAATVK